MLVFGSGALAGLLSSLLAYIARTAMGSSRLVVQDLFRVAAIIAAVGAAAAFLTALNMMALTVPESSSSRPKSKPQDQTPAPAAPTHAVPQTPLDRDRPLQRAVDRLYWVPSPKLAKGERLFIELNEDPGGNMLCARQRRRPNLSPKTWLSGPFLNSVC